MTRILVPKGFTLTELLIVIALGAIIVGLAAPSFEQFQLNNRITGVANDFLGTIQTARSEAIKRQRPVAICPSPNPDTAAPACGGNVFTGWIAFVDLNNNCTRDADAETIVRVGGTGAAAPGRPLTPVANGTCISFGSTGFMEAPPGDVSHTLFCDERGAAPQAGTNLSAARGVDISPTGRARVTRDPDEIAAWGVEADAVQCPDA